MTLIAIFSAAVGIPCVGRCLVSDQQHLAITAVAEKKHKFLNTGKAIS